MRVKEKDPGRREREESGILIPDLIFRAWRPLVSHVGPLPTRSGVQDNRHVLFSVAMDLESGYSFLGPPRSVSEATGKVPVGCVFSEEPSASKLIQVVGRTHFHVAVRSRARLLTSC